MKDSDVLLFPLKVSLSMDISSSLGKRKGELPKSKTNREEGESPQTCAEIKGSQKLTAGVEGTTFSPAETDSVLRSRVCDKGKP